MRNKKEQIPVQRLYMDRNQNRYKNIIWITFLALLLTGGTFLVIRESWKGQLSALPVCILTAGAGILCCVLAEIMRERIRFVTAIEGLPWIVLLVFTGAFRIVLPKDEKTEVEMAEEILADKKAKEK